LISVIGSIAGNLDKILLWHLLGAGLLAVYSFAMAPVNQISGLLKFILPLALPKLSLRDGKEIKKELPGKMFKLFALIALGVIMFIILAPYLYKIFFPQYMDAVKYSQLFALVLLFFPQKLIGAALQAKAKKKALYIISVSNSLIRIALYLILIPIYGIYGAIIANLIPYAWNTVLQIYYLKKM